MAKELCLKVFEGRSELVSAGRREVFLEGAPSEQAKQRYKKIAAALAEGLLENVISRCVAEPQSLSLDRLDSEQIDLLDSLVTAMTSEQGRALIGLTVMQLCIKSIEPDQSVRLHKGGSSKDGFSWRDGISMRSLDKKFITPALRRHNLLKLNQDGFMMTRTLAENYPYSKVYKARIRGARAQWAEIVERVEAGKLNPLAALEYLISKLLNNAETFKSLAHDTIKIVERLLAAGKVRNSQDVLEIINRHTGESDYAARIMEIAMHSLMQALSDNDALGDLTLKALSQMRSANKKHGNIGDIELLDEGDRIIESWDAKYGKGYLREELEELDDKLAAHEAVRVAGFVVTTDPERARELNKRRSEIESDKGIELPIITLEVWVARQFARAEDSGVTDIAVAVSWLRAYVESLAQMRPDIAPIDEPCQQWLESLREILVTA